MQPSADGAPDHHERSHPANVMACCPPSVNQCREHKDQQHTIVYHIIVDVGDGNAVIRHEKRINPKFGRSCTNENKGKKLSAFSFLNSEERFDLEYYKNRPGQLAELKEDCSGTEAEKTLRHFKRAENINPSAMTKHLEYITEELEEAGVCLTDKQLEKLLKLVSAFHNNSRLWGLSGWKPVELARMTLSCGLPAISFGPGLQKAFADGTMKREELIEGIRKLGLDVIE